MPRTAEQYRQSFDALWNARWRFPSDMNGDGVVTISDAMLWAKWIFFAPGDALFLATMKFAPGVAAFFELSLSGGLSALVSVPLWFIALTIFGLIFGD